MFFFLPRGCKFPESTAHAIYSIFFLHPWAWPPYMGECSEFALCFAQDILTAHWNGRERERGEGNGGASIRLIISPLLSCRKKKRKVRIILRSKEGKTIVEEEGFVITGNSKQFPLSITLLFLSSWLANKTGRSQTIQPANLFHLLHSF